jgi:hypothetical protein
MSTEVSISVGRQREPDEYRLPKNSPRLLELHHIRGNALHEVLDNVHGARVVNWGKTDDTEEAHEDVTVLIDFVQWVTQPEQVQAISAAAISIGKVLGTAALSEAAREGTKWLFERLRKKQTDGQIKRATIKPSPHENMVRVDLAPPEEGGRVFVSVQVEGEPLPY